MSWINIKSNKEWEPESETVSTWSQIRIYKIKMAQLVDLSVWMMSVSVPTQQGMSHRKPSQYFQRFSAYNHDCWQRFCSHKNPCFTSKNFFFFLVSLNQFRCVSSFPKFLEVFCHFQFECVSIWICAFKSLPKNWKQCQIQVVLRDELQSGPEVSKALFTTKQHVLRASMMLFQPSAGYQKDRESLLPPVAPSAEFQTRKSKRGAGSKWLWAPVVTRESLGKQRCSTFTHFHTFSWVCPEKVGEEEGFVRESSSCLRQLLDAQ